MCAEDGPLGVEITVGHRALHEVLNTLSGQGVLICLCSRNNEQDIWDTFDSNPNILLKLDNVVAHRIGWQSKVKSLEELVAELDLDLGSVVFLDDDPVICEEVEEALPEVLASKYLQIWWSLNYSPHFYGCSNLALPP